VSKRRKGSKTTRGGTIQTGAAPAAIAPPPTPALPIRPAGVLSPSVLIPVYALMIVVGYVVIHSGAATVKGNVQSPQKSLFAAVNAVTLTGFQQSTNVNDYTPIGQWTAFALTIGGILFSFLAAAPAVVRIARLPYSDGRVFVWSIGATIILMMLGGAALAGSGGGFFAGYFQALSAFGNSGLFTGKLPTADSVRTHLVLLPLAVLGGLGLPVLMDLFDYYRVGGTRCLSAHSQTTLRWTAGVYIVGFVLLLLLQWPGSTDSIEPWRNAAMLASRQTVNARSAGFPFNLGPGVVQWATILLMMIGASPAGTAGGFKVTTLATIASGTRRALRGGDDAPEANRPFAIALIWLAMYVLLLTASALTLVATEPQMHADRLLFLAASGLGNVGLSHDPVSLSETGWYVLSATMLVGRVAPVMVLWWMAETTPIATVAVG
jgi:trk system potassium uptake protein TrkH